MARYWKTSEINDLINDKMRDDAAAIILNKDLSDENRNKLTRELWVFVKYSAELIAKMEELDREEEEHMKELLARAKRTNEEAENRDQ